MENSVILSIIIASILCDFGETSTATISSTDRDIRHLLRRKRSLIYPPGSETKVQVLFGLGLPMEEEISMTLGYVLKCNYVLPSNSSDFTDDSYVRYVRKARTLNDESRGNSRSSSGLAKTGAISRWSLYRILEMAVDPRGSTGRVCLLRAVCETAETPFADDSAGLLGQLLRVVLTPSTTPENYDVYSDREYSAAEEIGRRSNGRACRSLFSDCVRSPLNYFTIGKDIFSP